MDLQGKSSFEIVMQSSPGPSETHGSTPLRNPFKNLNCLRAGQKEWKKRAIAINAMDELQGGEGKAAKRKSGAGSKGGGHRSWKNSGKMSSLGKTAYEEFISEELLAVRKAIKHSSPKKRCKQSLGKRTWKSQPNGH